MAPDSDLAGVYPAGELAPTGNAPICARTNAISHLEDRDDGTASTRSGARPTGRCRASSSRIDELHSQPQRGGYHRDWAILDLNHDFMLKQMVGTKLDVTKLLAATTKEAMPPLPAHPATLDIPHRIAVVPVPGCESRSLLRWRQAWPSHSRVTLAWGDGGRQGSDARISPDHRRPLCRAVSHRGQGA